MDGDNLKPTNNVFIINTKGNPKLYSGEDPDGYLQLLNIRVALYGKLPNKFQRFMLKKLLGIEIVKGAKEHGNS